MRIEKINEHQIRCTLYQKDLKDRRNPLAIGIRNRKSSALFRDMMQQAVLRFGFEADDIPLMIEAIPMLPDALILLSPKWKIPMNWIPAFQTLLTIRQSIIWMIPRQMILWSLTITKSLMQMTLISMDRIPQRIWILSKCSMKLILKQNGPDHGKADAVLDQLFPW